MSYGATDTQVVNALAVRGQGTAAEIADDIGEDWTSTNRALHRLRREGEVERSASTGIAWRLATPGHNQNRPEEGR